MNINHTKLLDEQEAGTITMDLRRKKMISLFGDAT
jgi:hypothetical protein